MNVLGLDTKQNQSNLGIQYLENSITFYDQLKFDESLSNLKKCIEFYKSLLSKKPHCKTSRKKILECWSLFFRLNNVFEGQFPSSTDSVKTTETFTVFNKIRDTLLHQEWKHQCNKKYGGPKPPYLSWKEFYEKCEMKFNSFSSFEVKLLWALENSHSKLSLDLIHSYQLDMSAISTFLTKDNLTLLEFCILKNDFQLFMYLVENNYQLNFKNKHGETYLHLAIKYNRLPMVKLLLDFNISINTKNKKQLTPLSYATYFKRIEMIELLIKKKASVNAKNNANIPPLYFSIIHNDVESTQLFIDKGAYLTFKDDFGRSYLHIAAMLNHTKIVEILLEKKFNINVKDKLGQTPLHYACKLNYFDLFLLLIKYNASYQVTDYFEESPLESAAFFEHQEIVSKLHLITNT